MATNDLINFKNCKDNDMSFVDCKLTCLLYPDGLVMLGDIPTAVQRSMDTSSEWCKGNGMEINPNKTQVMHSRHPRKVLYQTAFQYNGVPIKCTD